MPLENKIPNFEDDFEECLTQLIAEGSFPSFDQFKKNPDAWRERPEQLFESIDASMITGRKDLKNQKHYWRDGKESFTVEKLQRVVKEQGYKMSEVDMIPFRTYNTSGTGKDEIFVRVYPKSELHGMGAIVANA